MRYLACFRPTESLTSKLPKDRALSSPSSGLHCTIWGFNMDEQDEPSLKFRLSKIRSVQYKIMTQKMACFDGGSVVLLLNCPTELYALHSDVREVTRPLDKDTTKFDAMVAEYGSEKYQPHITLSKTPIELSDKFNGIKMQIDSYEILKKKDGIWQHVITYRFSG